MIKVTSFNKMPKLYHEYWAIVRSYSRPIEGVEWIEALSPSTLLFHKYLELRNSGKWNEESFSKFYVPQFLTDLKSNLYAKQCLNYLAEHSEMGERICLMCYCPDETLCHRSIIAGLLSGAGATISTDTGKDYSHYYKLYKEMG